MAAKDATGSTGPTRLRRLLFLAPLILFLIYFGAGWECEVRTQEMEVVVSPQTLPWYKEDTADLCFVRVGATLEGWIDANNGQGYEIARISSDDGGATWRDPVGRFVLNRKEDWERAQVTSPHVIRKDGAYEMFYSATSDPRLAVGYQIGMARSDDGTNWRKRPTPVLGTGESTGGDDFSVTDPCVIHHGKRYTMWYSGAEEVKGLPRFAVWRAASENGIHWGNRKAVVKDFLACAAPHVEHWGGTFHLWYVVATNISNPGFHELRYRSYKRGFDFGWRPWGKQTLLSHKDLGELAEHSVYSPFVDLDSSGKGWLYLSVHDRIGVWRIVRIPLEIRRTWFGLP